LSKRYAILTKGNKPASSKRKRSSREDDELEFGGGGDDFNLDEDRAVEDEQASVDDAERADAENEYAANAVVPPMRVCPDAPSKSGSSSYQSKMPDYKRRLLESERMERIKNRLTESVFPKASRPIPPEDMFEDNEGTQADLPDEPTAAPCPLSAPKRSFLQLIREVFVTTRLVRRKTED